MKIKIKRVYEPREKSDGIRILVDRLWPRGIGKTWIDLWLKDLAPSNALRKWYGHVPERWNEFRKRYLEELERNEAAVNEFTAAAKGKTLTLLYGARDTKNNQAEIILEFLRGARADKSASRPFAPSTDKPARQPQTHARRARAGNPRSRGRGRKEPTRTGKTAR